MRLRALLLGVICTACASSSGSYGIGLVEDRASLPRDDRTVAARERAYDAEKRPAPLKKERRRLTPPTERHLTSGVRVLLLESHDFPTVSASFILDRGSAAAPPGVAALYAEALRGSAEFSTKEAFEYFHYVGAQPSRWSNRDSVGFRVTALSPLLDGALVRVASIFAQPVFEGEPLELARREAASDAAKEAESPASVARSTVRGLVLGETHPYARSPYAVSGDRFKKMSRQELENFRDMFVVPERVTVAVVGDFATDRILARLEQRLSRLPRRKAADALVAAQPSPPPSRIVVVPRKGASQSNVAVGFAGAPRASDDRAALAILESLLGRALSGRLDLKVRGEHGYSYGVQMADRAWRSAGVVEITAAVDAKHTAEAVKGLVDELANVASQPIDPEDLSRARLYALSSLVDDDSSPALAELALLETIAAEDLPLDWYEKLATRIEALSEEDVRAAASRLLAKANVQIAVVGDPDAIVEPLRAIGLGDVIVRDAKNR